MKLILMTLCLTTIALGTFGIEQVKASQINCTNRSEQLMFTLFLEDEVNAKAGDATVWLEENKQFLGTFKAEKVSGHNKIDVVAKTTLPNNEYNGIYSASVSIIGKNGKFQGTVDLEGFSHIIQINCFSK